VCSAALPFFSFRLAAGVPFPDEEWLFTTPSEQRVRRQTVLPTWPWSTPLSLWLVEPAPARLTIPHKARSVVTSSPRRTTHKVTIAAGGSV
jgi:hypothetical protein